MASFKTTDEFTLVPEKRDPERASAAVRRIRAARRRSGEAPGVVHLPALVLPAGSVDVLEALLTEFAAGSVVRVAFRDNDTELSTTEAAQELGMSRPTLINLLEAGEIPFRRVGTHRRIRSSAVAEYRERMRPRIEREVASRRRRQLRKLKEMAKITDEAGEGY